jgi:hypothetical protein
MDNDAGNRLAQYLADLAINEPQMLPEVVLTLILSRLVAEVTSRLANGMVAQLVSLEDKLPE